MNTWSMYTADSGNELTVGLQAPEWRARQITQDTADRLGRAVELVCDDGGSNEVFEAEEEAI